MSLASSSHIITKKTKAISEIKSVNILTVDKINEIPSTLRKFKNKKINHTDCLNYSYVEKARNFIHSIESSVE